MVGGIYIVSLKNEEMISTQAHDRRFDNKTPLKVNKENRKFGRAEEFNGRKHQGYNRTFGKQNVSFTPIVTVEIKDLKKAENAVKLKLYKWRIRSPSNRLTEWTRGINESEMVQEILLAIRQLGIEHKVLT